ncbi:membrane protein [Bacteroidales bacterium]|nr:membrane protein [Bacteroidales bacterium]
MNKLINIIKGGISDSFHVWRAELDHTFKDLGVVIFFIVVPLIYPVLYGLIYNPEVVRKVPVVVVDQSQTSSSRSFVRKLGATADVAVIAHCPEMEEAKRLVDKKEAYGILLIPSEFSRQLHTGQKATIQLFCDMGSMLHYKAILMASTEASMNLGREIHILTEAIPYESISLYNTQSGFSSFLLPAILVLVIQQTLLLGVGMLAGTSRERTRSGLLIPSGKQYRGTLRVVFGKAMAYLLIYAYVAIWTLLIVPHIFELPQIAPYGNTLLFSLPYLLACIFFAMSLSFIIKSRETPMLVFVFTSVPLVFLSGVSWPVSAIPVFWKWVSYLFPSTFGVQGYVKLNSMGAKLSEISFEYKMLWILTGVYFVITCILYRWQVHKADKKRLEKSNF